MGYTRLDFVHWLFMVHAPNKQYLERGMFCAPNSEMHLITGVYGISVLVPMYVHMFVHVCIFNVCIFSVVFFLAGIGLELEDCSMLLLSQLLLVTSLLMEIFKKSSSTVS